MQPIGLIPGFTGPITTVAKTALNPLKGFGDPLENLSNQVIGAAARDGARGVRQISMA